MLVVMRMGASAEDVRQVVEAAQERGLKATPIPGTQRTAIAVTGNLGVVEPARFNSLPGVMEVIRVSQPQRLVSREFKDEDTIVRVGDVEIGGDALTIIAGPCAVESYEQTLQVAMATRDAGANMLRGGAFKPRSSPYSFQGLGREGLEILARVREEVGLPFVTEAIDIDVVDEVAELSDMVQVGARNMQNYSLLRKVGRCGRPVLLKRGFSASLSELLLSAEYIMDQGNEQVVLCERGVRTFGNHSRYSLDVAILPALEAATHLPVLADPSHAAGDWRKVRPLSRAALGAGADGLMVEVHLRPEEALSDGQQALRVEHFEQLMDDVRRLAPALGRQTQIFARPAR